MQTRVLTYTDAEYDAMYERGSQAAKDSVDGYTAGVNAWIEEVLTTSIDQLPAEYELLSAEPEPFVRNDVLAVGVLMTRSVASNGGNEMENVRALKSLEAAFGKEVGRDIFLDFRWQEDREAVATVPEEEGVFPRTSASDSEREQVFHDMADWATTLPTELEEGPGTGAHPEPSPDPTSLTVPTSADMGARAAEAIDEWRRLLSGGSFLVSIAPELTADGQALLMSEPQLGYAPTQLVELEVHGAGYDARGVSVPGIPTVGIGYTDKVAWALTTGNSKTITSFIEETREVDGTRQYRHGGVWRDMDCRTEQVDYRTAVEGVPVGPAAFTEEVEVCRTLHGPVVAETADGTSARTVSYDMWQHEVDTVEGVLGWNRAKNLEDFEAAMRQVTWNENTGYADADGHIAFWHPGKHAIHHPGTDFRLPVPGTGEYDHQGFLGFDDLPHAIDPEQGYLANWNNKPAHGWLDGEGFSASSYPAGHGHRVTNLTALIPTRDDWTFEDLREIDRVAGSEDVRAKEFVPLLLELSGDAALSDLEQQALDILEAWDWSANGPGAVMEFTEGETATVGAAKTIFDAFMVALVAELFDPVRGGEYDIVDDQMSKGRHVYDVGPVENLALRILDPATSSLTPRHDHLDGRSTTEVLHATLATATEELSAAQGEDPTTWRSDYEMAAVCSATGVIGPCLEMPFLERGTWIHLVGFTGTANPAAGGDEGTSGAPADDEQPDTPATGGGYGVAGLLGLLSIGLSSRLRGRGD